MPPAAERVPTGQAAQLVLPAAGAYSFGRQGMQRLEAGCGPDGFAAPGAAAAPFEVTVAAAGLAAALR